MGRIGIVRGFEQRDENGVKFAEVKVDLGGGNVVTATLHLPPGDDAWPIAGEFAFVEQSPGSGNWACTGVSDPQLSAEASAAGDRAFVARSALGTVTARIVLRATGEIEISNGSGNVTLNTDGTVDANGATVTTDGDVTTPEGVSLRNHLHNTGVGPTSPPLPS